MKPSPNTDSVQIADIITSRSSGDRDELIKGWQNLLTNLLTRMKPYLRDGHLVTFRTLTAPERRFFEDLHRTVTVPSSASALYLSPSVRHQMMYHRPESQSQPMEDPAVENPPDKGIVLAGRAEDFGIIVNALFAKPPFTPAIDVYEQGQLLAGYVYNTVQECIAALSGVLQVHLQGKNG